MKLLFDKKKKVILLILTEYTTRTSPLLNAL